MHIACPANLATPRLSVGGHGVPVRRQAILVEARRHRAHHQKAGATA